MRNSDIGLRLAVQSAVKKTVGVEVPVEFIQIKPPRIIIKNVSAAARSEIFIKKEKILEEIMIATGKDNLKEIS